MGYLMDEAMNPKEVLGSIYQKLFGKKSLIIKQAQAEHFSAKRTERISTRLTADEKRQLKDFSEATGIAYSTMIRIALKSITGLEE